MEGILTCKKIGNYKTSDRVFPITHLNWSKIILRKDLALVNKMTAQTEARSTSAERIG